MDAHREPPFDPAAELARIHAATGLLLRTAARLCDADARAPSLLPGWSRGHVLTHLARNADGPRPPHGAAAGPAGPGPRHVRLAWLMGRARPGVRAGAAHPAAPVPSRTAPALPVRTSAPGPARYAPRLRRPSPATPGAFGAAPELP
ncbi:maleylpyruvate isomerase N-terminal domain-containing protein [Kitasatospora aureofaciens]|uniref:maleylpyruvate isomerase N-terminal domain-containing protein n=1 Tax=Kitasatospora aureofaciens TaxID=1894 RepID=UPI0036F48A30